VKAPASPGKALSPGAGRWLWTCRAGFEPHLFEELAWAKADPRLLGAALVDSRAVREAPAFARMGFPVASVGPLEAASCAQALRRACAGERVHVQAWAPDADPYQPLQAIAAGLGEAVQTALQEQSLESAELAHERGGWLGQLCVVAQDRVVVGAVHAREALSLGPGGRRRMWRESGSLSRAALKVEEALDGFGLAPDKGERCVDLGAAPGGWTQRLLARGARVIAVDPAKLAPELQKHPKLEHVQESAFSFAPEEPVDWLFCDMAWRPLEVAQLLAKWARNGWADYLVANIKLPMNDKNPVLWRVRHTLEAAGWKELRVRQLYHDRDEVTVLARRR
jgi:23S rRNA (cytidine2498-2'-O)-methyltransferase